MTDLDASGLNEPEIQNEHWFVSRWRPACAWTFIWIVIYDLFLAPLIMQAIFAATNKPYQEWHPNTMLAGGFFYVAFGAILGVAVWNRTQEKLAVYNGPMGGGMMGATSTDMGSRPYQQPQPGPFQPPPYQPPPPRPPQPPISDADAQKAADLALGKP